MAISDHPDFSAFELGRAHDPLEVDTSDAVRDACLALIRKARREVVIMTRELDPVLFDNQETADALREFVLRSQRVRLRVLVKDPNLAVRNGHQVVALAQRLSSFAEIRVPAPEHDHYNAAFVMADGIGVVYRGLADRYEAVVAFGDRHLANETQRQFDLLWDTARPDPNLRRMVL